MEGSTVVYMILGMLTVASIYIMARCAEMARLVRREIRQEGRRPR
jgi:hypothetical protein